VADAVVVAGVVSVVTTVVVVAAVVDAVVVGGVAVVVAAVVAGTGACVVVGAVVASCVLVAAVVVARAVVTGELDSIVDTVGRLNPGRDGEPGPAPPSTLALRESFSEPVRSPTVQQALPFLKAAPVAETKVSWFGSTSQITTFLAAALPVFFQTIVKPAVPPALTTGVEARLTSEMDVVGTLAGCTDVFWRHTRTDTFAFFE